MSNLFSDPLKLIPFVIAVGVMAALALGRITATEAVTILAAGVAAHSGISALNNVNPPK